MINIIIIIPSFPNSFIPNGCFNKDYCPVVPEGFNNFLLLLVAFVHKYSQFISFSLKQFKRRNT